MKAIVVRNDNGPVVLKWQEVPEVTPEAHEVVLQVHATAVNRADLLQAKGLYPPPPGDSPILGLEVAGVVAAVGDQVSGWKPGDRACALMGGGGYAQLAAVDQQLLIPLPSHWSFSQGAAIPEVWLTGFSNLFIEGGLSAGQTVLLHAGASGVGTAGIQLARQAGARVMVTVGSGAKAAFCTKLGADLAIIYKQQDFAETVFAATDNLGVDLILDPVGGPYLERNLKLLKPGARLVNIGLMGGRQASLDMALVLGKSLKIIGSRLRARPLAEKIEITRQFRQRFWPLLIDGTMAPVIDTVFPVAEAGAAHQYVACNRNIGKVILEVPQGR
jgi:tumor protein p53-inducible protein 3